MANIEIQESDIENGEQPAEVVEAAPEVTQESTEPSEAVESTPEATQEPTETVEQTPVFANPRSGVGAKVIVGFVIIIVLALVGGLVVSLKDRNNLKHEVSKLSQPQVSAPDEAKQLSADVGKLIELPADETPTVATVVDASKVKSQAFFANAQNGDKVLLYSKSSKAILYRPSTKKIIEVAPINIGANQVQTGTTTTQKK